MMCWRALPTVAILLGFLCMGKEVLGEDGGDENKKLQYDHRHSRSLHREEGHHVVRFDDDLLGGRRTCGTPSMSLAEQIKADEDFQAWQSMKANGTYVGLQASSSQVDWSTTIVTIPTYFHVIHSGTEGQQFTYAANPAYIQDQIKTTNIGFGGEENTAFPPNPSGRSYDRYSVTNTDTKIQFCLMGTTATDNVSWYSLTNDGGNAEKAMKTALKKGGMETLNVYIGLPGDDLLGWAYFPQDVDPEVFDGVVLLNDSMPGGALGPYNQGDTLTHEVGHWLSLEHTHDNGCSGPGDYMDIAPPSVDYTSKAAKETEASFECPVNLDNCKNDGGRKNPIHSFMSYVQVS